MRLLTFATVARAAGPGLLLFALARTATGAGTPAASPELALQTGHTDAVTCAAYAPDGTLVTGSDDYSAKVWNPRTGDLLRTLRGHRGSVQGAGFGRGGRLLVTAGEDATLRIWDPQTGAPAGVLRIPAGGFPKCFAVSPANSFAAVGLDGPDGVAGTIQIWDLRTQLQLRTLSPGPDVATALGFTPDGTRLVSLSSAGKLRVWDVYSGAEGATSPITGAVRCFALAPDNRYGMVITEPGQVLRINLRTGTPARVVNLPAADARSVALSPNGRIVAVGGKSVRVMDLKEGTIAAFKPEMISEDRLAFSPDGKSLTSIGPPTGSGPATPEVHVWSTRTARLDHTLTGYQEGLIGLAFGAGDRSLVVGHTDGTVQVWDTRRGRVERGWTAAETPLWSIAVSPDKKILATGGGKAGTGELRLWELATGEELHQCTGPTEAVRGVAFSPDAVWLAAGGEDKSVRIYDALSGSLVYTYRDMNNDAVVRPIAFSPDGSLIAAGRQNGTVSIWKTGSHELAHTLMGGNGGVWSVAFSPDGKRLAASDHNGKVRIWDLAAPRDPVANFSPTGLRVYSIAYSPDSRTLACGDDEGQLTLWNAATGKLIGPAGQHELWLSGLAFSADGRVLAAASADRTVSLTNVQTKERFAQLYRPGGKGAALDFFTITPGGDYVASSGGENATRLRAELHVYPARRFSSIYHRPDRVEEVLSRNFTP